MKKLIIGFVGSLMLLTVSYAAPKDSAYSGEIMDSQCAKNGSHDAMLKKEGMEKMIGDPKAGMMCTANCVKWVASTSCSMPPRKRSTNWMISKNLPHLQVRKSQ